MSLGTLGEKLELVRELGRGGMGVIYEANDVTLRRRVAVKVMNEDLAADPDLRSRFAREARAAAQLESDHVVRVLEVDEHAGAPYIVMEYLDGEALDAMLARNGPLPIDRVVAYAIEALDGLAEAHALGLLHRDLKPGNLFVAKRRGRAPTVKVLDFGIAKDTRAGATILTKTDTPVGTPAYMAPEQIRGDAEIDARADLWALGVLMFELLTGDVPFPAASTAEMLVKILKSPAPPLRGARADAPATLEALIARCLAKDPAERPSSATELARELSAIQAPLAALGLADTMRRAPRRKRSASLTIVFAASALTIMALGFGAVILVVRSSPNAPRATEPTSRDAEPSPHEPVPITSDLDATTSEPAPTASAAQIRPSIKHDAAAPKPASTTPRSMIAHAWTNTSQQDVDDWLGQKQSALTSCAVQYGCPTHLNATVTVPLQGDVIIGFTAWSVPGLRSVTSCVDPDNYRSCIAFNVNAVLRRSCAGNCTVRFDLTTQ